MMFNDVEVPKCYFCIHSKHIKGTNDVICAKKGIVSQDYKCKKYKYDVFKREPKKKMRSINTGFTADDFKL